MSLPKKILLYGWIAICGGFFVILISGEIVATVIDMFTWEANPIIGTWQSAHADGKDEIVFLQGSSGMIISTRHDWGDEKIETPFSWSDVNGSLILRFFDPEFYAMFGVNRTRTIRFEIVDGTLVFDENTNRFTEIRNPAGGPARQVPAGTWARQ